MAYNPSTQIISPPVSIYDVQSCFGLSSPDLATLILTANINMWSGIKPIYSTKVTQLTTEDRGTPRVLSGFKTGGGIKKWASVFSSYITNMDSYGNPVSQLWAWDRPVLDGVCAFRLTDFAGYWHTAQNMFTIYSYIKNLTNIPIPSTDTTNDVNIEFMIFTRVISGCILAKELFGDCMSFYPGVLMTCGSGSYQYAKTTSQTIIQLLGSSDNFTGSVLINTAEFASAIAADWRSSHSGDPYANYPLRSDDKWTSCVILSSRELTGGSGSSHKFNSSDIIVRLEYEANVDRWTLPLKQDKYNVFESLSMTVTVSRQADQSGHMVYKLGTVYIYADKNATSASVSMAVTGVLQCQIGIVSIPNVGSATHPASLNADFGSLSFTQSSGQQIKSFAPNVYYEITATSSGNQLCNGTIRLYNANIGTFSGGFSIDVSGGSSSYTVSNIPLL